jgi:hypothetical protein
MIKNLKDEETSNVGSVLKKDQNITTTTKQLNSYGHKKATGLAIFRKRDKMYKILIRRGMFIYGSKC